MLFQSLLYCSNSCTSVHFKILKSHTKTLKIRPYMFLSPLKPSSGGPWPYFARLLNWNVDLHVIYKDCRYVAVCQLIIACACVRACACVCGGGIYLVDTKPRPDRYPHTHTHTQNELTYSHIPTLFITNVNQHSNSVT